MISEYMQNVNNKLASYIHQHVALQKINEALFVNTYVYFWFEITIYLLCYVVPLLLQMFYFKEPDQIRSCMMSCSIITGALVVQEFIEFRQQKLLDWFESYSNLFNIFIYMIFFKYQSLRLNEYIDIRVSPRDNFVELLDHDTHKVKLNDQFWLSMFSCILLFGLAFKLMMGFSVQPKFGRFVDLVTYVL